MTLRDYFSFQGRWNHLGGRLVPRNVPYHICRVYEGLREPDGIGEHGIIDASATIDEVLCGENGAWRGSDRS